MKVIFADAHIHNFRMFDHVEQGRSYRLGLGLRVVQEIKDFAIKNNASTLFAGDLFHTFSYVNNDALNGVAHLLEDWPRFYAVVGNHDVKSKGDYSMDDAGMSIFNKFKGVKVLNNELVTLQDGSTVYGVGWQNNKLDEVWTAYSKADILLSHRMINSEDFPEAEKVPEKLKVKYAWLIFGDVHKAELYGNVLIPGAPLQHSFKDEGQARGFWVLDDFGMMKFHEITLAPKFYTVPTIKDVKNDRDFYRVTGTVTTRDAEQSNVIAQQAVKYEYRDSGLSLDLTDAQLLKKYVEMRKASEDYVQPGVELLSQCVQSNLVPRDYKVTKVVVENFMSFVGRHEFSIDKGMHLVLGNNGNGKTSTFEALYWCLFGDTTKGVSSDNVVNDTVGKQCAVTAYLENSEGTKLEVNRFRAHKEKANRFYYQIFPNDGGPETQTIERETTKETQKDLEYVIGADSGLFKVMNYFSQEGFAFFSTLTDAAQKDVCKTMLPLDRFEAAAKLAKARVTEYVEQIQERSTSITVMTNTLNVKDVRAQELQVQSTRFEQERLLRIASIETELITREAKKKECEAAAKAALLSVGTHKAAKPVFDEKFYDDKIVNLDNCLNLDKDRVAGEFVQTLRDREALTVKLEKLQKECATTRVECMAKRDALVTISTQLEALKVPIIDTCSTCGQSLPKEKQEQLRKTIEDRKVALYAQWEKMTKANTVFNEELDELEKSIDLVRTDLTALGSKITLRDARIEELEAKHKSDCAMVNQNRFSAREKLLSEWSARVLLLEHEQINSDNMYTIANKEWQAMVEQHSRVSKEDNKFAWALQTLNKEIAEIKEQIGVQAELLKELEKHKLLYLFWQEGLGNQGIVSYVLDNFAKLFTELINGVLLNISKGRYYAVLSTQRKLKSGEYREKFEFILWIDNKPREYASLSGGQKARVNLATVVVLNKIIQKYYGFSYHPFGILVLDELFTYLDEEGVESVYYEIERFSEGNAVYIITNKQEVKSLFASTIYVDYDKDKGSQWVKQI